MAKRTKKAAGTGKFGARYGVKARNKYKKIDQKQRQAYPCPQCGHKKVMREGTGVWVCRKCGAKMAGGAYIPQTDAGIEAKKTIKSVLAEEE